MLNKECQNCISLFQDHLDGTLDPALQDVLRAHLEVCGECRDLLREYEQIDIMLRQTPPVTGSHASMPDVSKVIATAQKRSRVRKRQWASAAAVLLVFVSSAMLMDESFAPPETMEYGISSMEDQAAGAAAGDLSQDAAEETQEKMCLRYQADGDAADPFVEAQQDPDFAVLLAENDLGYGYELIDFTEEEDGSLTFVIYFYEDAQRTVNIGETDDEKLSYSNVRSLNWKESEL